MSLYFKLAITANSIKKKTHIYALANNIVATEKRICDLFFCKLFTPRELFF